MDDDDFDSRALVARTQDILRQVRTLADDIVQAVDSVTEFDEARRAAAQRALGEEQHDQH